MSQVISAIRKSQQGSRSLNAVARFFGRHVVQNGTGAAECARVNEMRRELGVSDAVRSRTCGAIRSFGTGSWLGVRKAAAEISTTVQKVKVCECGPGLAVLPRLAALKGGARSTIQKVTVEIKSLQNTTPWVVRKIPQWLLTQQSRKMATTASVAVEASGSSAVAKAAAMAVSRVPSLVTAGPVAQKQVSLWLFGCAGWVFSMVVLGGATRLTKSGLSMTDWKFTGSLPPMNQEEWEREFEKYKQSPEYRRVHRWMSVDDFKFIFYMEYIHRMWGRGLGFFFALPCAYFLKKGYITKALGARLGLLFGAGAGQGLVGWWMVRSGLKEPETEWKEPRVSPYRLAAHLTVAFAIYSGLIWTGLSVATPRGILPLPPPSMAAAMLKTRRLALPLSVIIGITAISGAFVAGNDAGRAFNTWPLMGDSLMPAGMISMQPTIRNFFENTATVQFQHRMLAYTATAGVGVLWMATRRMPLDPATQLLVKSLLGVTLLQVTLGVSTLLTYVPTSLGTAHQAGALTLFTIALALIHSLSPRHLRLSAAGRTVASSMAADTGKMAASIFHGKGPAPAAFTKSQSIH